MDEVRILVECAEPGVCRALQDAFRVEIGLRLEVSAVPPQSLPRWELKARRVTRRER